MARLPLISLWVALFCGVTIWIIPILKSKQPESLESALERAVAHTTLSDGRELYVLSAYFNPHNQYPPQALVGHKGWGMETSENLGWDGMSALKVIFATVENGELTALDPASASVTSMDSDTEFDHTNALPTYSVWAPRLSSHLDLTEANFFRYPKSETSFHLRFHDEARAVIASLKIPNPTADLISKQHWVAEPVPLTKATGNAVVTIHHASTELQGLPTSAQREQMPSSKSASEEYEPSLKRPHELIVARTEVSCESPTNPPENWRLLHWDLLDPQNNSAKILFPNSRSSHPPIEAKDGITHLTFFGLHPASKTWKLETQWIREHSARFDSNEKLTALVQELPDYGILRPLLQTPPGMTSAIQSITLAGPSLLTVEEGKIIKSDPAGLGGSVGVNYLGVGNDRGHQRTIRIGAPAIILQLPVSPPGDLHISAQAKIRDKFHAFKEVTRNGVLRWESSEYELRILALDSADLETDNEAFHLNDVTLDIYVQQPIKADFLVGF